MAQAVKAQAHGPGFQLPECMEELSEGLCTCSHTAGQAGEENPAAHWTVQPSQGALGQCETLSQKVRWRAGPGREEEQLLTLIPSTMLGSSLTEQLPNSCYSKSSVSNTLFWPFVDTLIHVVVHTHRLKLE